jgi:hypothetical protein
MLHAVPPQSDERSRKLAGVTSALLQKHQQRVAAARHEQSLDGLAVAEDAATGLVAEGVVAATDECGSSRGAGVAAPGAGAACTAAPAATTPPPASPRAESGAEGTLTEPSMVGSAAEESGPSSPGAATPAATPSPSKLEEVSLVTPAKEAGDLGGRGLGGTE